MGFEFIVYEISEKVATLYLNRPNSLNTLNEGMKEEIKEAFCIAAEGKNIRALVLTGKGRFFCAGADLYRFKKDYEHFERTGESSRFYDITLPRIFAFFPKPLIAAVNGPAVGVGMTMMLACDIRLASESASFSCPFTRIGLTPEFGSSYHLPRLVGYARAAEWILTGRTIKAQEALSTGLINRLVAPEALLDEARNIAQIIATMPEKAVGAAKRLLCQALDSSLDEALERETKVFQDCQKDRTHYLAVCKLLEQMKAKK